MLGDDVGQTAAARRHPRPSEDPAHRSVLPQSSVPCAGGRRKEVGAIYLFRVQRLRVLATARADNRVSLPHARGMDDAAFDSALITAAFQVIAERGWDRLSVSEAARAADLPLARARE